MCGSFKSQRVLSLPLFFIEHHSVPEGGCSFCLGLIEELEPTLMDGYKSATLTFLGMNPEILELFVTSK